MRPFLALVLIAGCGSPAAPATPQPRPTIEGSWKETPELHLDLYPDGTFAEALYAGATLTCTGRGTYRNDGRYLALVYTFNNCQGAPAEQSYEVVSVTAELAEVRPPGMAHTWMWARAPGPLITPDMIGPPPPRVVTDEDREVLERVVEANVAAPPAGWTLIERYAGTTDPWGYVVQRVSVGSGRMYVVQTTLWATCDATLNDTVNEFSFSKLPHDGNGPERVQNFGLKPFLDDVEGSPNFAVGVHCAQRDIPVSIQVWQLPPTP